MNAMTKPMAHVLHEAVAAIYFDDSFDYKGALWNIVRHLAPDLVGTLENNPKHAFDVSQQRLAGAQHHGAYAALLTAAQELLVSWDCVRAGRDTIPEFEKLRAATDVLDPAKPAPAVECPVCAGTHTAFGKRCACTQGETKP